jgi:hypothetical protein
LRVRFDLRVIRFLAIMAGLVVCFARSVGAQETVFDVPSADVLERGKVYGELDGTVRPVNPPGATFTPRVVFGIGHDIEVGLNFNGLAAPSTGQLDLSPTIKWRPWHTDSGWSFYVGDDLFFPVRDRGYEAGNYVYAAFAKEWTGSGTRVSAGAYDFTRNVVATGNRAGGQFTIEQSVAKRVTLAAEWYTGNNAVGYVNPGAVWKLTKKLTLYTAYQIGNSGVTRGNHNFLWEFGYNFN